jgi:hypothetical protein
MVEKFSPPTTIASATIFVLLLAFPFPQTVESAYFSQFSMRKPAYDPCYDSSGRPQRCVPDFINAVCFCLNILQKSKKNQKFRPSESQ